MASERVRRVGIVAAAGAATLLAGTAAAWAPELGTRIPWFDVDRVEISGAALLAPYEVLAASGIHQGDSIFDDHAVWERALLLHPVIDGVEISRRAPGTLLVRIIEKRPIAFIQAGTLRPVTGDGEVLPVDPTRVPLDLPIVHGSPDDSISAANLRTLLREVALLADSDGLLIDDVSEVRALAEGEDAMVLLHSVGEIVVPFGTTPARASELRSVVADVRRRFRPEEASGSGRTRIDLRFGDQIVVRPTPARELS